MSAGMKWFGAALTTALVATPAAVASADLPPCSATVITNCVGAAGSGDAWNVGGQGGSGGAEGSGGNAPAGGRGSNAPAGPPTRTHFAPTCTGNTAFDSGVLCNAAVLSCPEEGDVQFWKWQSTLVDGAWTGWRLVDTVCLGPGEEAVDPVTLVPGIVQRDFQSVVVMKGGADVSPKPETLVNLPTRFRTDAPASYQIPLSILGQSVVITARAEKHTWYFGDGESAVSRAAAGAIEHTYRSAQTRQAYVVITWSGTFTVNGGASQPISGTVETTGAPTEVVVQQARSELVRD